MEKVVVVTVTYNSNEYLKKCIEHLNNQTYKVFKIIVVDNHSTEEIHKLNMKLQSDNVEILYLDTNTGGAGGFEYGMKHSQKYNPDWVWLMDDDAFPESDCLSNLLSFKDKENVGCLCPAIFGDNLKAYQIYHHKKMSKFFVEKPAFQSFEMFPEIFTVEANAFVGPLVKQEVINELGVADGQLFIYGDDTEYTFRISRKYKVYVVKNAKINHRDVIINDKTNDYKSWWKDYYNYRNRYLLIKKYATSFLQKLISVSLLKTNIRKRILGSLLKRKYKGYRAIRIKLFKQALRDGRKGIKGKTIDPIEYNKLFL